MQRAVWRISEAIWFCVVLPSFVLWNQFWIFIGRTDAEAETPVPGHLMRRKDCDAGRDWRQEEKGTTEDEMTGWHHRLRGHEFEQALEVGDGQGSLAFFPGITKSWTRLSNWTLCCDNIQHTTEVTEMSVYSCSLVKTAGPNESGGWWCQSERRQVDF